MIAAGTVVAVALATGGPADKPPIAAALPFTLEPVLAGAPPAALASRPGRPVVLAFFAAWCDPCRRELPALQALAARAGGPQVVGVDFLDQRADALALLASSRVTFPAGYDHDGAEGGRWGVTGLPVTVFIASDGRVAHYHRGELGAPELGRLAASTR